MADISPDLFMDAVLAYQQTAAIKAALELDLFTEMGKGNATADRGIALETPSTNCSGLALRGEDRFYRLVSSDTAREVGLEEFAACWEGLDDPQTGKAALHDFNEIGDFPLLCAEWWTGRGRHGAVCPGEGTVPAGFPQAFQWSAQPRHLQPAVSPT